MKLTSLGKVALLLLVGGAAWGGYSILKKREVFHSAETSVRATAEGTAGIATGQSSAPNQNTAGDGATKTGTIQLVTSASRKGWMLDQIEKFNATRAGKTQVKAKYLETREGMHAILSGKVQPTLYAPSSIIWADRLAKVWDDKTGQTLLDTADESSYRILMRSPLVFLTTQEKARTLRPLLGTSAVWSNIRALSIGKKSLPWGRLKWAHADPMSANSGMLTLALITADYADRTNQGGAIERVATSAAFLNYLKSLESRMVMDSAVKKGSSALAKSFGDDPSRYDFIVAYESVALQMVLKNPSLAVIYPTPTINAENSIAVLDWPSQSPDAKQTARDFMNFVASPESLREGTREFFRPVRGTGIEKQIQQFAANGFQRSYSAIEVPPYEVLNSVAFSWQQQLGG